MEATRRTGDLFYSESISCLLCTTWRSGSTHFGSVVESNLGLPLAEEVLWSREERQPLARIVSASDLVEHVDELVKRIRTESGFFGAKLMWPHLKEAIVAIQGLPKWAGASDLEIVRRLFPSPRFVLLTREDKVRQGISLFRASATGVLHLKRNGEFYERRGARHVVEYERREIESAIDRLKKSDHGWQEFFARNNVVPTAISYEEVCEDLLGAVNRVLDLVGAERCSPEKALTENFAIMRDDRTERWADKFRAGK